MCYPLHAVQFQEWYSGFELSVPGMLFSQLSTFDERVGARVEPLFNRRGVADFATQLRNDTRVISTTD